MKNVLLRVADEWGMSVELLVGPSREKEIVEARYVAAYLLRERGESLITIGRLMNRDHTTILYALDRMRSRLADDDELAVRVRRIQGELNPESLPRGTGLELLEGVGHVPMHPSIRSTRADLEAMLKTPRVG